MKVNHANLNLEPQALHGSAGFNGVALKVSPAAPSGADTLSPCPNSQVKKIFLRILRKVMEIPNESPLVRKGAPSTLFRNKARLSHSCRTQNPLQKPC